MAPNIYIFSIEESQSFGTQLIKLSNSTLFLVRTNLIIIWQLKIYGNLCKVEIFQKQLL